MGRKYVAGRRNSLCKGPEFKNTKHSTIVNGIVSMVSAANELKMKTDKATELRRASYQISRELLKAVRLRNKSSWVLESSLTAV